MEQIPEEIRIPILEAIPPPPRQPEEIRVEANSAPPEIRLYLRDGEDVMLDEFDDAACIELVGNASEVANSLERAAAWLRGFPKTKRDWFITAED